MPRGFISRGYADIFGYIYIIVETRRPNQRVLLFERKKRVSVETLFKTQYTRSTLAELRSAAGGFLTLLLSALRAKTIDFTGDFKILSLRLTDHFTHFTAYPVEAFLGRKCFVYNSGQLFRIISYLLTVCQFG